MTESKELDSPLRPLLDRMIAARQLSVVDADSLLQSSAASASFQREDDVLRWLAGVKHVRTVFMTHGEDEAALALASRVAQERGFKTHAPQMGESVEI